MKKIITVIIISVIPLICFAQNSPVQTASKEGDKEQIYIPKDLDDCFRELKKILPKEQIEEFKKAKEENAVDNAHMGLGRWMRNNWGLLAGNSWLAKYFKDKGVNNPDDMSGIISTSFHRHLNNKPIELQKQVKYYKDWWKERDKEEKEKKQREKKEVLTLGLNQRATIKDIWEDKSLKNWNIQVTLVKLESNGALITVYSSTFTGKDYNGTVFLEVGEHLQIAQSEEVFSTIKLDKIIEDRVVLSLRIYPAPPAPKVSAQPLTIEIK